MKAKTKMIGTQLLIIYSCHVTIYFMSNPRNGEWQVLHPVTVQVQQRQQAGQAFHISAAVRYIFSVVFVWILWNISCYLRCFTAYAMSGLVKMLSGRKREREWRVAAFQVHAKNR